MEKMVIDICINFKVFGFDHFKLFAEQPIKHNQISFL